MDSLPLETFQEILGYMIETEPIQNTVNARLVNHCWEQSITSLLIRNPRLETALGINRARTTDAHSSRWRPFPLRMKMLYMLHKVNQHHRTPTTFSVWIENMLEIRGIDDSDPDFRRDVIQQLIGGAAVGNLIPVEIFRAAETLTVNEGTRVPDLLSVPWELLQKTYWILVAVNAMNTGDAEGLDYLLAHGYDMTALSMRFRVCIMKSTGVVESEEIVRVLVKHRAPFTFEGREFRLDRHYLYGSLDSGNREELEELLDHLKTCFRRAMGPLVSAGIEYAKFIGRYGLALFLEHRQIEEAQLEFPDLDWDHARYESRSLDWLFES